MKSAHLVLTEAKHTYFGIEEREVHRAKRNENDGIQNAMDILANYEIENDVSFMAVPNGIIHDIEEDLL